MAWDWLIEIGKYGPSSVVSIAMLVIFVGYMKHRDKMFADELKNIGKDCHEHQVKVVGSLTSTIERSEEAMHKNTEMLGQVKHALDRIKV